jgi:hypothetical protein
MPALTINGITIPIRADTFAEERTSIGDVYQRSIGGAMFSSMVSQRRRFRFSTPPIEASLAEKYAMLIEGKAQVWNFDNSLMSGAGVTYYVSGGASTSSSPKKYGTQSLALTAGAGFELQLANKFGLPGGWTTYGFGRTGWTFAFWMFSTIAADGVAADGWYHYIVTGVDPVTRGAAANPFSIRQYRNGVLGSYGFGNMLKVDSSTTSGVFAYAPAGTTLARNFDDLVVLPFVLPDEWVSSFYSYASSFDDVTNLVTQSQNLGATWTISANCAATVASVVSPNGSSAYLLNMTSGVANTGALIAATFTGDGEKVASFYLRSSGVPSPASSTDLSIYDNTATVHRHLVRVAWGPDGSPTLSTVSGSGTRFAPVDVGNGWWRISFTATGVVATNANLIRIYPATTSALTGGVFVWGVQAENATRPGLYLPTFGSTATRTPGSGYSPAPLVDMAGDHLEYDINVPQFRVFGRVEAVDHVNMKTSKNYRTMPNAKVLNVTLEQQ